MKITKGITSSELVEILKKQKIGTFAFLKIETVLKMNKKNYHVQ